MARSLLIGRMAGCLLPVGLLLIAPLVCLAESVDFTGPVDFTREVFPVLRRSCLECHGPNAQEGGLRLDQAEDLRASGSVVPGQADESELLRRVGLPTGHDEAMPAVGEPLAPRDVAILRRWIDEGAHWPADFQAPAHWAYVAPIRPEPPEVANPAWVRSPLDSFVLSRLEAEGIEPAPQAAPEKLIRRVYFDLIGLPPTPAEVQAFVADPSADRLEQRVDELLARPQFGERWARPWLDLARYADSHGFQRDDLREIWPYRDWVIQALNDDMPFDQFTIEQIAGDLLPDATEAQRIATGFHRATPTNVEAGSLPEETRIEQVFDRVNTTATVWLATTLECCQCHDHKYDPFPIEDYYRMLAFFNNTAQEADRADPKNVSSIRFEGPSMTLSNPERAERHQQLKSEQAELQKRLKARRAELLETLPDWLAVEGNIDPKSALPGVINAAKRPQDKWNDKQRELLLDYRLKQDEAGAAITQELASLAQPLEETAPETTLVMIEQDEPRPTMVFERGNYQSPGEPVEPGTPAVLHPLEEGPANRLTLARWLVARDNPLVARVVVNRWWAELFGQGIVTTEEDFGIKGAPPTHPELLDWLAVELMDNGWSQKKLLKTIVMSATYQQSSRIRPELQERDDRNLLLARGPRFRMDAEMIRDNALAISGLLSLKQGGPPIRPYQPAGIWTKVGGEKYTYEVSPGDEQYRRGVYVVIKRGSAYPSFLTFDATSRLTCTVKRSRTNTPLQALTLLNDPVYVDAAEALADRVLTEQAGQPLEQQLDYAFQLCTARPPSERERATLRDLYQASSVLAANKQQNAERQAWVRIAQALLNLHETITKD